jgi:hypothetical protein
MECSSFVKKNFEAFTKNWDTCNYVTRNGNALETVRHSTSQFKYSPYFSSSKIYNKLPDDIKKLSLVKFKSKLRSYLVPKCYYNMNDFFNENWCECFTGWEKFKKFIYIVTLLKGLWFIFYIKLNLGCLSRGYGVLVMMDN